MEGDQNNQHKKFVCKFCNRRFQCGKSLGGHIRTHLNKKPTREKEQELIVVEEDEFARETRTANLSTLDQSGYRLRENPKKSWRFADHKVPSFQLQQQMKVCKECGKGFMSLKALCGHMACHSDKERRVEEVEEFSSEKQKLVMDSQSDTETSTAPAKQRRVSKRLRESSNFEVHGGCSSVSGVEQEQQEVAISLMMLSRDSGYKGGLNSFGESSDNNSVILEGKSSSIDMRISNKRGLSYGAKVSDVLELKRAREKKMKYEEVTVSDNSDSGYYIHEPKKVESDVSVDGFVRNGEFKKYRAEFRSGFGGYDSYDVKSSRGFGIKSEMDQMVKELPKEEAYEQVDRSSSKYALRKSIKNGFPKPFTSGSSSVEVYKNVKKSSKYECLTCNKTFHSHRALGGHRASHTKSNGYSESMYESGENSIDSDESPIPTPQSKLVVDNKPYKGKTPVNQDLGAKRNSGSKRSKGHECPFCFKVFKSGQALGGHKRSHFVGGCEVKTVVLGQDHQQQELEEEEDDEEEEEEDHENEADIPTLFDLNLPAPMEEEATGSFEYMSW